MQNLENLPDGSKYNPPERIVCAANKYNDVVIPGIRHGCNAMCDILDHMILLDKKFNRRGEIQGFLTSKHRFVDRQEAWKIAVEQNQIVRLVGGNDSKGGTLYSENLY